MEQTTIDRDALYEQVWLKPLTHLAKEYGLSDVGLKKICNKMEVPTPPRGHWQRIEHGHKVEQIPLPELTEKGVDRVAIASRAPSEPKKELLTERQQEALASVEEEEPESTLHPFVERSLKSFNAAKADEKGILHPRANKALDFKITKGSLDRAFSTASKLLTALEAIGCEVAMDLEESPKLRLQINGETIRLSIEEKVRRHERIPDDKDQRKDRWYWKEYDYEPTGKLKVEAHGRFLQYQGIRKSWSDGRVQRVDEITSRIVVGLVEAAEAMKQKQIERENKEREWAEERRKREEERKLRELEKQRQEHLKILVEQHDQVVRMQSFISAVEKDVGQFSGLQIQDMSVDEWLEWAKGFVEQSDPLKEHQWWDIESLVPFRTMRESWY